MGRESCPVAEESRQGGGLGRAIHLRRVELGMKRADVAKGADLSYPYISEIENGVKQPSVAALGRIAEALDLSVSELAALSEQYAEEPADRTAWTPLTTGPVEGVVLRSPAVAPRQSSQLLRNEMAFAMPTSIPGGPELEELVRRIVHEELTRWERDQLPELVRAELRRRLDQAMGADDR